jgi:aspartate/methionine/tyrosine aminotransferase
LVTVADRFRRRRDLALGLLSRARQVRVHPPGGGFYLYADVSAKGESLAIARALLERSVVTIPGEAFGRRGAGWLRISYAAAESDLERGLSIVTEYLS